ncbi:MAG: HAD family hydrolase [Rhodospirillales bacterium]|nr:HAD family hydrolase [Rhodospirillales bacterium]
MKGTRPHAILFDWDNTLVDNWETIRTAINAALVAFGKAPWTLAETHARVRRSLRETFPEMFGAGWEDARDIFYRTFEAEHLATLREIEGAGAALAELARAAPLAVVSNKQGRLLRREADALGWTRHFHRLVGANDAARDKPDPAPVEMALNGIEIPDRGRVWFVGDTALDMQAAHAAGCIPVLFGNTEQDQGTLERYPATFVVKSYGELLDIFRGLQSNSECPK